MRRNDDAGGPAAGVADRLHSAAIHLLRRLRREDSAAALSGPELSALSVVVFGGAQRLGELAQAEQVSAPTMSRLVRQLEARGLVERATDAGDRRVVWIGATERGERLLNEGRARRVESLAEQLRALPAGELEALEEAVGVLERVLQEGWRSRAGDDGGSG